MEIPLNAQVECTDGVCGRSAYVLINPVIDEVTHLVVKEDSYLNTEYIVPVEFVGETVAGTIQLRFSKAELVKMNPFIKTTYIEAKVPESKTIAYGGGMGLTYWAPYVTPEVIVYETEKVQQIPPGELIAHRGTRVEATDGFVGHVDEFVVNPESCQITHLVMREGHLWGQKDVIIPLLAIGTTKDDTVFLKLTKDQIGSLPTFPVHRRWS